MTGAVAPLVFAASLLALGQYVLPRLTWTHRAPRLGIAVWQAILGAAIVSLLLGILALMMPGLSAAATIGELLRACAIEIRQQYATPTGATTTTLSFVALGAVGGRILLALWRQRQIDQRSRRQHLAGLAIVADQPRDGLVVIDHAAAAAYCVPGSRRAGTTDTVVVTTGAMKALSHQQMSLVLRHEQAHLNSRHSRLIARAHALSSAFPKVGFFRVAHRQIALLAEMHADDAVEVGDRRSLAEALYELAIANRPTPPAALAATGSDVVLRAHRLLGPHRPLNRAATALAVFAIIGLGLTPITLALVPGGISDSHRCCLIERDTTSTPPAFKVITHETLPKTRA